MEMCKSVMLSANLGIPSRKFSIVQVQDHFLQLEEYYEDVKKSEAGQPPHEQELYAACHGQRGGARPILQQLWFPTSEGMKDCCHLSYNFHPSQNKPVNQPWVSMHFLLRSQKNWYLLGAKQWLTSSPQEAFSRVSSHLAIGKYA